MLGCSGGGIASRILRRARGGRNRYQCGRARLRLWIRWIPVPDRYWSHCSQRIELGLALRNAMLQGWTGGGGQRDEQSSKDAGKADRLRERAAGKTLRRVPYLLLRRHPD